MKKRKIWKINYLLGAMIITVLCLVTSCGRNESVKTTGEYIRSYESERDGVPVGLFPINTGYFVFSLLDEDLLGKTMRSDDLENFNEIVKDENGYPLYELADSFDNTICWVEYTGEKACYYAYQAENEKMIKICELSDSERVSDEADYCGIYQNNYIYMKRDSVKNCIDIISYDMDKEYMQVMYSCDYISNLNYSLSVKGNYLSVLLGKKILKYDLEAGQYQLLDVPSEISAPTYVDYDTDGMRYAIYDFNDKKNKIYLYDLKENNNVEVYEFPKKYKADRAKVVIKNNKIIWVNRKYHIGGGYIKYYDLKIYDIDKNVIESIDGVFNYSFVNENELYYFTYPLPDSVNKVDMYIYSIDK